MEADISIWRKPGHFYFALTRTDRKAIFNFHRRAKGTHFGGEDSQAEALSLATTLKNVTATSRTRPSQR